MAKYREDNSFLKVLSNEEAHALRYHLLGSCFLANYLLADKSLKKTSICAHLEKVLAFWNTTHEKRQPEHEEEYFAFVLLYGLVGKALFFINAPSPRGQLLTELQRFCNDPQQLIGNYFLFYIAGLLAGKGYAITFLQEEVLKTPDIRAESNNGYFFIECNARQPQQVINDPQKIRQQVKALIEEKRPKFREVRFRPGVITGEVTPIFKLFDKNGKQKDLQLSFDTYESNLTGLNLFHLERDPSWLTDPYNENSALKHLVEEFSLQDNNNSVAAVYLAIARQVYKSQSAYSAPRAGLLLLDSREDPNKYSGLSNLIYLVNKDLVRRQLLT